MTRWSRWSIATFLALSLAFIRVADPHGAGASQEGYTVADMVVWTYPTPEGSGFGHCIYLGGGTLDIWVQGIPPEVGPVEFQFQSYRDADPGARIAAIVSQEGNSFSLRLAGGLYCYTLANRAFAGPQPVADIRSLGEQVVLRMTLAP